MTAPCTHGPPKNKGQTPTKAWPEEEEEEEEEDEENDEQAGGDSERADMTNLETNEEGNRDRSD